MNKIQLREHIPKLLGSLAADSKRKQSEDIFRKLVQHPRYKEATRLSIYLSTRNEIDTIQILKHALEVGKHCFVPFVRNTKTETACDIDETRMIMVELASMNDFEALPVNKFGIREHKIVPSSRQVASARRGNLDLVIVPGVAFCLDGRRLGHGKGYYDEFLAHWMRAAPRAPYTVGLAFLEQIVDDVPVDGQDVNLDEILTATG